MVFVQSVDHINCIPANNLFLFSERSQVSKTQSTKDKLLNSQLFWASIKLLMYKLGWDPAVSTCRLVLDPWLWLGEVLILAWPLVPSENKTWTFLWPWSISPSEKDSSPFLQVVLGGKKPLWLTISIYIPGESKEVVDLLILNLKRHCKSSFFLFLLLLRYFVFDI